MRVLTDDGFKRFDGVLKRFNTEEKCEMDFDGDIVRCTKDHKFKIDDEFIEAERCSQVKSLFTSEEFVYDLINVEDTHSYYTNGVISHNCLVVDECAFIPNAQWDDFWAGTYPVISSGKETKTILISTPAGLNHFYKIWSDAKQGISTFNPIEVNWWDVPGRDEKWKKDMIGDIGDRRFAQEYGNDFLGSANTLISPGTLSSLAIQNPINVKDDLRVYEYAKKDHIYFMTVDVGYGRGQDYSTFSIFDITEYPFKQVATYRSNNISPELYPNYIFNVGMNYNEAFVLVENNDIGKVVLQILNHELEYENIVSLGDGKIGRVPELGCRMTSRVKTIGCSNLKDTLEDRKLIVVDENTILELNTFIAKGSSFEADSGKTDDSVMNLVLFGYAIRTELFEDISNHNYRESMYQARIESLENDMMSFFTTDELEDTSWLQ